MTEPRSEIIPIRLTPAEAQALRSQAAEDLRPVSQWARVQLLKVLDVTPARPSEVTQ